MELFLVNLLTFFFLKSQLLNVHDVIENLLHHARFYI